MPVNTEYEQVASELRQRPLPKRIERFQSQLEQAAARQGMTKLSNLVIRYARPDLPIIREGRSGNTPLEMGGGGMYTSSPFTNLNLAADGLQSQVVSEAIDWFQYRVRDQELQQDDQVQEWQQRCERYFYDLFTDTNFYPQCPDMFQDAMSLGNAPMFVEEDVSRGKPVCQKLFIGNVYLTVDQHDEIQAVHRRFWLNAQAAFDMFKGANLSRELLRAVIQDPTQQFEFLHACYRKDNSLLEGVPPQWRNREWMCFYIQADNPNNASDAGILRSEGYHRLPYLNWRYMRNDTYGRGVLGNAIVTVQSLHFAHRDLQDASAKAINGPVIADRSFQGRLRLNPRGVNWRENPNQDITPVYRQLEYPFGVDIVQRFENEVAELLNVSLLLILTRSEKEMTAREAMLRLQEKAALLGPRVRWLERDFLNPVHNLFWDIEEAAGRIPEPPRVILDRMAAGLDISVDTKYIGPLSQTQQALYSTRKMEATLATAEPVMRIAPDVIHKVKWDEVFEEILDRGNWNQATIRSDAEYRRIMQERKELQDQMADAQLNQQNADAANKLMTGMRAAV